MNSYLLIEAALLTLNVLPKREKRSYPVVTYNSYHLTYWRSIAQLSKGNGNYYTIYSSNG